MDDNKVSKNLFTRMFSLLLALVILAGALPQGAFAASPAQTVACSTRYTVKSGDTLSGIAFTYDVSVEEIAAANSLTTPYTIFVGQVLCIPSSTTTPTTGTGTSTSTDPGITAVRTDRQLFVTTQNLPNKTFYYVKIRDPFRNLDKFVKLGNIRTKKLGAIERKFQIPTALRNKPILQVCIRDVRTDKEYCTLVYNPNR
jgi:LysM repeat protein